MVHISWIMFAFVLVIGVRLLWGLRHPVHRPKVYKFLVAGVFVSSLLFFHKTWSFWALLIVFGFMLGCSILSRNRNRMVQYLLTVCSILLLTCGILGINSPIAPVIIAGPSMWPTSPKSVSAAWLTTNSFVSRELQYGDDVYFEVKKSASWPSGRYRKRIWALPGDTIEIVNNTVVLNHKIIANCSDRSRRIAPNIWWCTITFPNGVERKITWGLSNTTWIPQLHTTMEPHQAFAVGDNTVESTDSRFLEPIQTGWIEGYFEGKGRPTPWVAW